jgi:hypothetical protein
MGASPPLVAGQRSGNGFTDDRHTGNGDGHEPMDHSGV